MDTRGLEEDKLVAGVGRSSLEELTDWALWADAGAWSGDPESAGG